MGLAVALCTGTNPELPELVAATVVAENTQSARSKNQHDHQNEECPVRAHQSLQQPGRFLDQEVGVHLQFFSGQLHASNKLLRQICGVCFERLPPVALATREAVSWPWIDLLYMGQIISRRGLC